MDEQKKLERLKDDIRLLIRNDLDIVCDDCEIILMFAVRKCSGGSMSSIGGEGSNPIADIELLEDHLKDYKIKIFDNL